MALPEFVIGFEKRSAYGDAGVVYQNIRPPTEPGDHRGKGAANTFAVGYIANDGQRFDAMFVMNRSGNVFDLFPGTRRHRDVCAFTSKSKSDGAANAASATGD